MFRLDGALMPTGASDHLLSVWELCPEPNAACAFDAVSRNERGEPSLTTVGLSNPGL